MKLTSRLTPLLLLSSSPTLTLAREDPNFNPDPALNARPKNVTDLAYWLYGWVGSYYNGTTTFHFTPLLTEDPLEDDQDEDEAGVVCNTFANKTASFSFDSLVAVTRPDTSTEFPNSGGSPPPQSNPVMFLLKSFLPGANLLPQPIAGLYTEQFPSDQIDALSWSFQSVAPPENDNEASKKPRWDLKLDKPTKPDGINTLFGISATPKYYPPDYSSLSIPGLQINMSTCDNLAPTWWGASFLTMNDSLPSRDRIIPVDPTFRLAFDNQSASFQYAGYYFMNTDPGNDVLDNEDPKRNSLLGMVRVEFLGSIDRARSDVLVEDRDGKPAWKPVIGFGNGTGTIDAGVSGSGAGGLRNTLPGILGMVSVGMVSLGWVL